jgi:dolichol-phosphate mannosyltransferase
VSQANVASTSVDIVIPLCNERDSIQQLGQRLESLQARLGARYRVHYLFVDDGSTDGTGELLATAVPSSATFEILTHDVNRGVGAAFRTAFQHVKADYVCTIDADCSYGPENLMQMILDLEQGSTDVAVASPYHPAGTVEGVQPWRIALSANCSRLYRLVTPLKLYTYTSIFRAYRGHAVRGLAVENDGFVAAVEILLRVDRLGYRVAEVPMTLSRRSTGQSKMRIGKTIGAHLGLMKKCLFSRDGGYPVAERKQATTVTVDSH